MWKKILLELEVTIRETKFKWQCFFFYKIDVNIKDELFYIFYNRENMCCNKKHLISKSVHEFWKNSQECMYNNYKKKIQPIFSPIFTQFFKIKCEIILILISRLSIIFTLCNCNTKTYECTFWTKLKCYVQLRLLCYSVFTIWLVTCLEYC